MKVTPAGALGWAASGYVTLCTNSSYQSVSNVLWYNNALWAVWNDDRAGQNSQTTYIQKMDAAGMLAWSAAGVLVNSLPAFSPEPKLVPSDNGAVLALYITKYSARPNETDEEATANYRGLMELAQVRDLLMASGFKQFGRLEFDPTLARGLSYYTGCIFEVKINNVQMGSVSGGGRYDNLTGSFGLPGVSGVGFSFGVDRLYDCLEALDLFMATAETPTRCLITHFDAASGRAALPLLAQLRAAGIPSELYPDAKKLGVQFKYADAKGIPLVLIMGPEEITAGVVKVKIMQTGVGRVLPLGEVVAALTAE